MILGDQFRYVAKRETVAKDRITEKNLSCLVPTENTILEQVERKVRGATDAYIDILTSVSVHYQSNP